MNIPTVHSHVYQLTAQRIEQLGGLDAAINKCAQPHTDPTRQPTPAEPPDLGRVLGVTTRFTEEPMTADYLKRAEAPTLAYDYRDRDDREDAS